MKRQQPLLILAVVLGILGTAIPAEDPIAATVTALRMKRGEAIVRENEIAIRKLEGALGPARIQKNAAEIDRLEVLIEQLRTENAQLKTTGDKHTLMPTNPKEFRTFLLGTQWAFDGTQKNAYEFFSDGSFKSQKGNFQYAIVGPRRVTIVWSEASKVDCQLNDDGTALVELEGLHGVLKRVR